LEMIGAKLSKEWKDVDNEKLYEVGWGRRKGKIFLLEVGEAKFWLC
jgi:hypothetical protein